MRQTSLIAFFQLQDWLKNKTYAAIINFIENNPDGVTDREICFCLGYTDPNKIRPRRRELEKMNIIYNNNKRICKVSSKLAMTWKIYEQEKRGI